MSKAAETSTTKDGPAPKARRLFFVSLFDLTWRLAAAMLGPLFLGLWIDSLRDKGQLFALIGFGVGMVCGVLVIKNVVNKLSKGKL